MASSVIMGVPKIGDVSEMVSLSLHSPFFPLPLSCLFFYSSLYPPSIPLSHVPLFILIQYTIHDMLTKISFNYFNFITKSNLPPSFPPDIKTATPQPEMKTKVKEKLPPIARVL